jgi:hypothetical protein
MAIVDQPLFTAKTIVVQTTHGQVFVSKNFTVYVDDPAPEFIKIVDDDDTFWFNKLNLVYIGPR